MRRALNHNLVPYDPEIEQTLAKIRKAKRIEAQAMAEENNHRAIRDYFKPVLNEHYSGIARQPVEPNNFELKPALINMVQQNQFGGSPIDDPNTHLSMFLEICDTIKINGVAHDTVKLRLFPFSLRDKARSWLHSLQPGSIVTWEEMAQKFLAKFFPPAKTALLRTEIGTFKQHDFEPLYESWERFKDLLRRCPQHGYQDWLQIQLFYNGLNGQTRTIVDAAAGGTLLSKTAMEAHTLLEEMASNNYQWPNERNIPRKIAGIHETDQFTALSAQISALSNQFATLTAQGAPQVPSPSTESVAMASATYQGVDPTMEQAQFVNNRNFNYRGNQLPNYYHPGLRNHENLSYGNNKNVLQPPPGYNSQAVEKKPSLEDHLAAFITETRSRFNKNEARLDNLETHMLNMGATMKSLEVQIGQLATSINLSQKGKLPSDTEVNPKEQCMAITLRSGKKVDNIRKEGITSKTVQFEEEKQEKKDNVEEVQSKEVERPLSKLFPDNPPILKPALPFPQRFQKKKIDAQFAKFLEIFKKIQINIPFADALEQMPQYMKFMKEIMSKKRRLEDLGTVKLTEECSAILQKKIPQKLKDPGSFTIPCNIGGNSFDKALCDLGASINLMPLSVFRKLGLGDVKPTSITLQLADRSLTYPKGIIEDVLVKVDKFIFPADFVVLDMEEDNAIPLILGRPFLATGKAKFDVEKGELTMSCEDENVKFQITPSMSEHEDMKVCLKNRYDGIRGRGDKILQKN